MKTKRKTIIEIKGRSKSMKIVTDHVAYAKRDQVMPLHPENLFFIEQIDERKMKNASVLDIGIGCGVLSIAAGRFFDAKHVTGLEINSRAITFVGYNILQNGLEDCIEIKEGNLEEIFKPVTGKTFDYIIANPPFEPTPHGFNYYMHSAAGVYGTDILEKILKEISDYMAPNGYAQIACYGVGNHKGPIILQKLLADSCGNKKLVVNQLPVAYPLFMQRFAALGVTAEELRDINKKANNEGITHIWLCMLHYQHGKQQLIITPSQTIYQKWDIPLDSAVPMGCKSR
ncbi:class I SAM-dependent methyltransferase [Candidatus Woesearchaeota archaeon]|nr:class I SAM-dependent methyltransferase [Candidatus Woesearchaeota archaeon]